MKCLFTSCRFTFKAKMLTTVYFVKAQNVYLNGENYFALPGQYLDLEKSDALCLFENGIVFLEDEGVLNDLQNKSNNSTGVAPDRIDSSKNVSKSRRKRRRHVNK